MNFDLPIDLARLRNSRLALVPVETVLDSFAAALVANTADSPGSPSAAAVWSYLPYGPFEHPSDWIAWYTQTIQPARNATIFAIVILPGADNSSSSTQEHGGSGAGSGASSSTNITDSVETPPVLFAGTTGLLNTVATHAATELGHVLIFPRFQHSWVQSTANALLLRHLLDPAPLDLGLRRVQWQCNVANSASRGAATKLGFAFEGVCRWQRAMEVGWEKRGVGRVGAHQIDGRQRSDEEVPKTVRVVSTNSSSAGRVEEVEVEVGLGRHSAVYSMCWDDWVMGKRGRVLGLLARSEMK